MLEGSQQNTGAEDPPREENLGANMLDSGTVASIAGTEKWVYKTAAEG